MSGINWDNPAARLALIERVGTAEYNRLMAEYREKSIVARTGGHAIRPVSTRYGRLFAVGDTGRAFSTMAEAEEYAKANAIN